MMYTSDQEQQLLCIEMEIITQFFHAAATTRKRVNRILQDDNDKASDIHAMSLIAKKYFLDLFQKKNSTASPIISVIRRTVSNDDNLLLTTSFTKEELWVAMFSMHPDKCPGLDGYNPGFYQQFWNLCSDEIFKECCV